MVEWGKTFDSYDLRSIANTDDGGYILTGLSGTIKTDAVGNIQWEKPSIVGQSVIQTNDNGFLVLDYTTASKLTSTGEVDWIKGIGIDPFCAIEVLSGDNGFVIGGRTGDDEFAATKISKEGEVFWLKSYGGLDYLNGITSIVHDGIGGFMMAGYHNVVCNIASDGSLIFLNKLTNRLGRSGDWHPSYILPSANGFVIGTTIDTNIDDYLSNCWIIEIDHQGIQLRDNIIERQGNYVTGGIAQSSDGYVVIGGNGLWVAKVRFEN
jgi:hypothetical protein